MSLTAIGGSCIQEQIMVAIFGWCECFDFIYWFIPERWVQYMFGC
jgi:hypothetical protein